MSKTNKSFRGIEVGSMAVEYAIMMALVIVVCVTTITSSDGNTDMKSESVLTASH